MLILLTILLLTAAVSAYFYFYRRENTGRYLKPLPPENDMSHLRPLFQPTEEDLRLEKIENEKRIKESETREMEAAEAVKVIDFGQRLKIWHSSPNKNSIADLLVSADGSAGLFADAAESIYDAWQAGEVSNLSAGDLAQMLESHFWLVPAEKRTPGVGFRVQRLLSSLRSASENKQQTRYS